MPPWLESAIAESPAVSPAILAWRIGTALVLGLAVAGLNRWARRGDVAHPALTTTLVLLSAVIAMATQVIGDNVARAFSLVGALSVVRFRTVVKDTQDTAFVIFAVVVGMAAGANHLTVALVGLGLLALASMFLWPVHRQPEKAPAAGVLSLRAGLDESIRGAAESALALSAERFELMSVSTCRQGTALDLTYSVRLRPGCSLAGLVAELNQLEGVESVELKRSD